MSVENLREISESALALQREQERHLRSERDVEDTRRAETWFQSNKASLLERMRLTALRGGNQISGIDTPAGVSEFYVYLLVKREFERRRDIKVRYVRYYGKVGYTLIQW